MHHPNKGFTLVELSIVLVIIGMLTAAVLSGQHLIHQSQVRKFIGDLENYQSAILTYNYTFNSWPGDTPNATTLWPNATTVNGDGDNIIEWANEVYRSWQHLSLAKSIEGDWPGTHTSTNAVPGINIPETPFDKAGYNLRSTVANDTYIMVGHENPDTNTWADDSFIKPRDAKAVDAKLDDGMPNTGVVRGSTANDQLPTQTCIANATATTDYTVTNNFLACQMWFYINR